MKLVANRVERDRSGEVVLIPEENEDMWHCFNLIARLDRIKAGTWRKVQSESSTGSVESSRVHTVLTIEVTNIDFDTQACVLRLNGRNVEENKFVKMGAFHTIDLELNQKVSIIKEEWDSIAFERINVACDPSKTADVAAVVMQEGLANVCLITSSMTIIRERIHPSIPRKRKGDVAQYEKGMIRFFEQILKSIELHVNFDVVKCLILASPGFVKDQFYSYLFEQAVKYEKRTFLENKSKIMLVHSSSGHKSSLKEVLQEPSVATRLADTKAASEIKALDTFFQTLNNDPDRAFYGLRHVTAANERNAIDTLLISDALFRASDVNTRRRYVELVESVKNVGGKALVFSSAHVSGEQLDQLTGVAAILRFPLPDVADEIEEELQPANAQNSDNEDNNEAGAADDLLD